MSALHRELRTAIKLTDLGISEIHKIDMENDFIYLPFQLLSQGLERFLKLTLAMTIYERDGKLPSETYFRKRYGHDLSKLLKDLVKIIDGFPDLVDHSGIRFLKEDDDLNKLISQLSEFGKSGRYHSFDEFLAPDKSDSGKDPYRKWQATEMGFIQCNPKWLTKTQQRLEVLQHDSMRYVAQILDRFTHTLAQLWVHKITHGDAKKCSGLLGPFLSLSGDSFGIPRGE